MVFYQQVGRRETRTLAAGVDAGEGGEKGKDVFHAPKKQSSCWIHRWNSLSEKNKNVHADSKKEKLKLPDATKMSNAYKTAPFFAASHNWPALSGGKEPPRHTPQQYAKGADPKKYQRGDLKEIQTSRFGKTTLTEVKDKKL